MAPAPLPRYKAACDLWLKIKMLSDKLIGFLFLHENSNIFVLHIFWFLIFGMLLMLVTSCWLKVESPVLSCFVSIHSHCNSIWNKCTAWSKQQQCHVGSPCLSFSNYPVWQNWTQTGEDIGFSWDGWIHKFAQQSFSPGLPLITCLLNYNYHPFPRVWWMWL